MRACSGAERSHGISDAFVVVDEYLALRRLLKKQITQAVASGLE